MKSLGRIARDERDHAAKRKDKDRPHTSKTESDRRPEIPGHVRQALVAIIDYLWDDEFRHFTVNNPKGNMEDHIFSQLVIVGTWLEGDGN